MKGYLQIPRGDFTESFSTVAADATICIFIGMVLYKKGWVCHMFDAKATFLNANMENPMYLKWPDDMAKLGFIDDEEEKKMY